MHTTPRQLQLVRGTRAAVALVTALAAALAVLSTGPASAGVVRTSAAPALVVPAAATPAGKLPPSDCAGVGTGAVTCDLFASAGTTQLAGTTVPIWGFARTAGATPTAPGPVLTVTEGDDVTIKVHNGLTGQHLSLALPGQPADQFSAGLNDTAGVASGEVATYTFHAARPGTFLYEAGHTPDGARQVAMGLAGALVVLAQNGTASGQAYDDDGVVVLSEVDPAFNAHPDTFDMRSFHPTWRLINGRPFPSTSAIPTDQGHTVLLRYVNVGSLTHPMSLLGADQLQVAVDGHPQAPQREVVAELDSGSTAETLVHMPTGPESKITLFEEGSHLDDAGAPGTDPGTVAIGGMMTFLDTAAPPVDTDIVGPAVAHAAVTPSVSNGLTDVHVEADVSDAKSGGSGIAAAEFVVDDSSIAVGNGIAMSGASGQTTAHVTGTLPAHPAGGHSCTDTPVPVALECLPAGKHTLYVRGQDDASSHNWGVISSVVLNLPKTGPSTTGGSASPSPTNGSKALTFSATGDDSAADGTIDRAEYFVDTPGADGTGTPLSTNRSATVVSEDGSLPATPPATKTCSDVVAVSCLTEGPHVLMVHSHDDLGLWGPPLSIGFTVDKTGPGVDTVAVAPSATNGLISAPGTPGNLKVSAIVTDASGGGALQSNVVGAEGFLAPTGTPADGTGFALIATDGSFDSPSENVYGTIPLSQVRTRPDGTIQVYVHGKDAAGNWGPRTAVDLVVDKTAPVLASVTGSPNPTNGAALLTLAAPVSKDTAFQAAEFWTGTTDPGVGKATRVSVSFVNGQAVVSAPLAGITPGSVRFNLRVLDLAGNWSNAVSTTVSVSKPNAIFSDTFDSGSLTAWSARTNTGAGSMGTVAVGGNPAMTVTGTGTHFVTDNTPAAETGYHAQFRFTPGTLSNTATNGGTVFDVRAGQNGGGALVLGVQLRKQGTTNQVRLDLNRSNGTTSSGWVNLPAGTPVVRVDWTSATAGSAQLSLNGTSAASLTGNTNAIRAESARLGLITTGTSGTGTIDDFVSTRNTLP